MPTLGRLRKENCLEPEANLVYIASLCFKNKQPPNADCKVQQGNLELGLKGQVWAQDPRTKFSAHRRFICPQRDKGPGIRNKDKRQRTRQEEGKDVGGGVRQRLASG